MATGIYFVVDDTLHRGYRDHSGRFTLEQCNLAKANLVDNLKEYPEGGILPDGFDDFDRCENCFPKETA